MSQPEELVSPAFALGWHVAELYRLRPAGEAPPPAASGGAPTAGTAPATATAPVAQGAADDGERGGDLPGVGDLTDAQLVALRLDQITVDLQTIGPSVTAAGLSAPPLPASADLLAGASARRAGVQTLHVGLLSALTATDFRVGKAYELGRMLADTCREPCDQASLGAQFEASHVAAVRACISDLTSLLPAHAGHAVDNSLGCWAQWAQRAVRQLAEPRLSDTVRSVRRQGTMWRSLLSAEKQAVDLLGLDDYTAAAGNSMRRTSGICGRFLLRFWWLALIVLLLFAGGIAAIVVAETTTNVLAGAGALLASIGITWRTATVTLGNVFRKLETPVWEAEVDEAIIYAVTLDPARSLLTREALGPLMARAARRRARRAMRARPAAPPPIAGPPSGDQPLQPAAAP